MGFSPDVVAFIAAMTRSGVDYERTLMIGRQWAFSTGPQIAAAFREAGFQMSEKDALRLRAESNYGEPILRRLGAETIQSVDASDYEGCTIVHDLNEALDTAHRGAYSVVLDGGTLEHVFDLPTALRTCLETVAVGGHFLSVTPVNNYSGHGFYQFTPELFYRVLDERGGFRVKHMLWKSQWPSARWYRVPDPASVGHRVENRRRSGPAVRRGETGRRRAGAADTTSAERLCVGVGATRAWCPAPERGRARRQARRRAPQRSLRARAGDSTTATAPEGLARVAHSRARRPDQSESGLRAGSTCGPGTRRGGWTAAGGDGMTGRYATATSTAGRTLWPL